jgi:hypothetical protein
MRNNLLLQEFMCFNVCIYFTGCMNTKLKFTNLIPTENGKKLFMMHYIYLQFLRVSIFCCKRIFYDNRCFDSGTY